MKLIKLFILVLCAFIFSASNAQWQPTGNLTVFSDNGQKFFLILNGEKYNDVAETNVRIEELQNPYYSCKIIFEDSSIPTISKNMVAVVDGEGKYQDVTYRIKQAGNGKYNMMPYSMIPAVQNMARPANCAVYRYGTPRQHYNYTTQTTTTTVVAPPAQTVVVTQPVQPVMSVNVPGISVNVGTPVVPVTTTTVITTNEPTHYEHHEEYRPLYQVGAKVQVNWKGSWYPAKVLDIRPNTNEYFIKYDGWDDNWNEWVGLDRIAK